MLSQIESALLQSYREAVEVLLAKRAFVVKRVRGDKAGKLGQITWSKCDGIESAWAKAKQLADWPKK